jgi:glycosyltransferase involved in cell wall biosynthesis
MNSQKTALLITGMHRSGTSLLTQILHMCGVAVAEKLEPPNEYNITGYWESIELVKLHDKMLKEAQSSWKDVGEFPKTWLQSSQSAPYEKLIQDFIFREFSDKSLFTIKDPRVSRFVPFWEKTLKRNNIDSKLIIPFRNPYAVAKSLQHRDNLHSDRSLLLWVRHILEAEKNSRHLKRSFINYNALLLDWRQTLARLCDDLKIKLPIESKSLNTDVDKVILSKEDHYGQPTPPPNPNNIEALAWDIYQTILSENIENLHIKFDAYYQKLQSLSDLISPTLKHQDNKLDQEIEISNRKSKEIQYLKEKGANQEEKIASKIEENKQLNQAIENLQKESKQVKRNLHERNSELLERNKELYKRNSELLERNAELHERNKELQSFIIHYQSVLKNTENELNSVYQSQSWKITKPLRKCRRILSIILSFFIQCASKITANTWRSLPLPTDKKTRIKSILFSKFGWLFSETNAYKNWRSFNTLETDNSSQSFADTMYKILDIPVNPVHTRNHLPPNKVDVKLIAFYLPQFHSIPENDKWWGKGFTEWTNVRPTTPMFEGHYQPHIPGELGYYDILQNGVMASQVELAKLYGIGGFCFYFYWFGGKRLLEQPVIKYFSATELNFPACLCWANENWTRTWDGLDKDLLIGQKHTPEDDIAFISHISQYLTNSKYIRINGRPLLLVYRPGELPNAKATAKRWRKWCQENGIGEIYLAYTQSFETIDPSEIGFDAAIEFPPNNSTPPNITNQIKPFHQDYAGNIYDWRIFLERSRNYSTPNYKLFRSVCPGWDNTARKKLKGTVFTNSNPEDYCSWLINAIADTKKRFTNKDEQLVFVNAWNEWAEGAHLEPDEKYGYAYLDATLKALTYSNDNYLGKILLVSHDAHPHGAQLLVLNMARYYKNIGLDVSILVGGDGPLVADYKSVCEVKVLAGDKKNLSSYLIELTSTGCRTAIVNSAASGWLIPEIKRCGMKVLSLVHELPNIINSMKLENAALEMGHQSDTVIFASDKVLEGFTPFLKQDANIKVMPQGLYKKNTTLITKGRSYCRKALRKKYALEETAKIVIAIGGADLRKGADLFVETANIVTKTHKNIYFIWIGKVLEDVKYRLGKLLAVAPAPGNIIIEDCWQDTDIFYGGGDVFALTSREDPFPSVVLEAFDASMPVIAFDKCGGFTDIVSDSTGYLVTPFDSQEYAGAILNLLNNQKIKKCKGSAAKKIIDEQYSFHQYCFNLLDNSSIKLPKVTVILPNYNYEKIITERIINICNQSLLPYEMIILDDGSSDNSQKTIKEAIKDINIPIKLIFSTTNSGSVFSQWKKGLSSASGDYVWIAEADDLAEPNFLQEVSTKLLLDEVVLSYCQSSQMAEDGSQLALNYHSYTNDICLNRWQEDYVHNGEDEIRDALCVKNTIPNVSAVVFDREKLTSIINQLGEKLTRMKVAGDWLVYLYMLKEGRIAYTSNSLNHHRRHDSSVTSSLASEIHYKEVRDMQLLSRELVPISEELIHRSDNYAMHLAKHFSIEYTNQN